MNEQQFLKAGERIDDLQRDGLRIIQNPKLFCFGMDAVLLADFAQAHASERVLDLCTGTGVVPTLMYAKTKCRCFTGVELHEATAGMAQRSVQLNGLQGVLRILQGDVRAVGELIGKQSFDAVTCNPPYMSAGHGLTRESAKTARRFGGAESGRETGAAAMAGQETGAVTMARHEVCASLRDVVSAADYALREQGRLYMVHRPSRMAEIICTLKEYRLEVKRLRLVYPMADRKPNMLLIEARKGGAPGMIAEPPLIVYREPGIYTDEIIRIYDVG